MHRIFVGSESITPESIIIPNNEQAHHIQNVLHSRKGDEIAVVDDKGNEYFTVIECFSSRGVELKVKSKKDSSSLKPGVSLTVACALPKNVKFDDIVDKLTQLGVERIIPLRTQRVVVKMDAIKEAARLERWKKIALSASCQSQRNKVPVIDPVSDLDEVLSCCADFDLKLIPVLIDQRKTIKEVLSAGKYSRIIILIGPEGDFTSQEVSLAKKEGFIPVTLGKLVLRVDTAAMATAGFVQLYENI